MVKTFSSYFQNFKFSFVTILTKRYLFLWGHIPSLVFLKNLVEMEGVLRGDNELFPELKAKEEIDSN